MLGLPPALPREGLELDLTRSGKIKFYTLSYTCTSWKELALTQSPHGYKPSLMHYKSIPTGIPTHSGSGSGSGSTALPHTNAQSAPLV